MQDFLYFLSNPYDFDVLLLKSHMIVLAGICNSVDLLGVFIYNDHKTDAAEMHLILNLGITL